MNTLKKQISKPIYLIIPVMLLALSSTINSDNIDGENILILINERLYHCIHDKIDRYITES
ncbi:MAG TPA: hypothetical protein ENG62_01795 [Thermoplasmatales archaeon]|nr:hypothetical protein [Thermoplasmatales archaeon]